VNNALKKTKEHKFYYILNNRLTKNKPLFYIYDDGTVEKRIVIE